MKKTKIFSLIISIILVAVGLLVFASKNYTNNSEGTNTTFDSLKDLPSISIMLETSANSGNYEKTTGITYTDVVNKGYTFNTDLSKCDNSGALTWDDTSKSIVFSGTISDSCNVYFDKKILPILTSYITDTLYTVDGANGLYYHDGVGTYTNANLEAGDNSYRYSGQYSYPKATEGYDTFDKIVIFDSPWKTNCTLGYDETGTKYSYNDAINKAINDGYLQESINNYLCFKKGCTDNEKYRIIGVIDNKVKVIKLTSIEDKAWDNINYTNAWEGSTMETYLNGEYLTNLGTNANLIDVATWHVGGITGTQIESENAKGIYTIELSGTSTIDRKIGLMYANDYMYAADPIYWNLAGYNDDDATKDYRASKGKDWMLPNTSNEWIISRRSEDTIYAALISHQGRFGSQYTTTEFASRPVFSLLSSVELLSGTGTADDPYIVI